MPRSDAGLVDEPGVPGDPAALPRGWLGSKVTCQDTTAAGIASPARAVAGFLRSHPAGAQNFSSAMVCSFVRSANPKRGRRRLIRYGRPGRPIGLTERRAA